MPKIYDQDKDPERESEKRTVGASDAPEKVQKRNMVLVVAAILAVILIVLFYRMARGDEIQGAVTLAEASTVSTSSQL